MSANCASELLAIQVRSGQRTGNLSSPKLSFPVPLQTKLCVSRKTFFPVSAASSSEASGPSGNPPQNTDGALLPSGEWPENFSLLNFEDLSAHYHPKVATDGEQLHKEGSGNADVAEGGADRGGAPMGVGPPAQPGVLPNGEWPENFSMLNFEDLSAHYEPIIFKKEAQPTTLIANLMKTEVRFAYPSTPVAEVAPYFADVTGLPVVDQSLTCVGVLSKKDVTEAKEGALVSQHMSSPPVTVEPFSTVLDAAVLMLKSKVHRLPVVDEGGKLVGIVTRTDIFTALGSFGEEA